MSDLELFSCCWSDSGTTWWTCYKCGNRVNMIYKYWKYMSSAKWNVYRICYNCSYLSDLSNIKSIHYAGDGREIRYDKIWSNMCCRMEKL